MTPFENEAWYDKHHLRPQPRSHDRTPTQYLSSVPSTHEDTPHHRYPANPNFHMQAVSTRAYNTSPDPLSRHHRVSTCAPHVSNNFTHACSRLLAHAHLIARPSPRSQPHRSAMSASQLRFSPSCCSTMCILGLKRASAVGAITLLTRCNELVVCVTAGLGASLAALQCKRCV